jgi:hypothetical protein
MKPQRYPLDQIPYDYMREDDRIWIPELLLFRDLAYQFTFDADGRLLQGKKLN